MFRSWSLGQPPGQSRPNLATGRGIDLSVSPVGPARGRTGEEMNVRVVAGHAGRDWLGDLHDWVERHKYYPNQAAELGEDGTVVVRVRVARDGRVQDVDLVDRSGSQLLDLALLGLFRRAQLPQFPPNMTDSEITFDFTMHYILLH